MIFIDGQRLRTIEASLKPLIRPAYRHQAVELYHRGNHTSDELLEALRKQLMQ